MLEHPYGVILHTLFYRTCITPFKVAREQPYGVEFSKALTVLYRHGTMSIVTISADK